METEIECLKEMLMNTKEEISVLEVELESLLSAIEQEMSNKDMYMTKYNNLMIRYEEQKSQLASVISKLKCFKTKNVKDKLQSRDGLISSQK